MSFKELASRRYSVRSYNSKNVEKESIVRILETARIAPSAVNFQPWKIIVVTDESLLKQLHEAYPRDWFKTAPVCLVALGDHDRGWHRPNDQKDYTDIDVTIAIDHLMLAATEEGIGSCWICNFNAEMVSDLFDLPSNLEPIALVPLGYPLNVETPEKKRKPLNQLISWNGLD